ncbi:HEPN domain-containing protein [Methylobacterium sp. 174MFSha1.1]|uniref:HEPN domain-containing protein n=1 Tax=Methylobacterium sp. 174MFSha1.1 TaxID=1502749 RepID=UPI0008F1FA70|nr:HEPN domain-containing protein [Methylobacterium sp. 174MFSha1.1]SFV06413.1 HEPN domain-containing protein [Methylobacterium sp. 174MFSha1.1]
MPSVSSPASLHIANHLRLADRDLKDAVILHKCRSRNDAYHLEQAAEKLLLALLTSEGEHVQVKDVHILDRLADRLPEDHPLRTAMQGLGYLKTYATAFRYPKSGGRLPTTIPDHKFDLASSVLRRLIDASAEHFQVDLNASDDFPAENPKPMRRNSRL